MSYAHINVWRLSEAGTSWESTTAREIGEHLRQQPGFLFYGLIRTAEWEAIAVTIFASAHALENALMRIAPLVRDRLAPLTAGEPERRKGVVIYAVTAGGEFDARAA